MTYTIYGMLRSGAFSTEAALAEAGADYTFENISLDKNEQKGAAYLALNPSGKIPALRLPEGAVVTESLAILLIVAERFPEAQLLPPERSAARAQALRWLAFMACEIYPFVEISDYPERFVAAGEQAEALREKARARIRSNLLVIEREIAEPWFLKDKFSVLDIYAAMFTRWRGTIGKAWLSSGHIPKLLALADRLSTRERIAPVWQRHYGKD